MSTTTSDILRTLTMPEALLRGYEVHVLYPCGELLFRRKYSKVVYAVRSVDGMTGRLAQVLYSCNGTHYNLFRRDDNDHIYYEVPEWGTPE